MEIVLTNSYSLFQNQKMEVHIPFNAIIPSSHLACIKTVLRFDNIGLWSEHMNPFMQQVLEVEINFSGVDGYEQSTRKSYVHLHVTYLQSSRIL